MLAICQTEVTETPDMAPRTTTPTQQERYRDLLLLVLKNTDSKKVAGAMLGTDPASVSRVIHEHRGASMSQLEDAQDALGITRDYFNSAAPPESLDAVIEQFRATKTEQSGGHIRHEYLEDVLAYNPAVEAYLKSEDGDGTPTPIAIQIARIDWEAMGVPRGAPSHDDLHKVRCLLQRIVRESL